MIYRTSVNGWGSNLFGMLMTLAANPNAEMVLDETDWAYKCNEAGSWRDFFVGTTPLTREDLPDPEACETVRYASK